MVESEWSKLSEVVRNLKSEDDECSPGSSESDQWSLPYNGCHGSESQHQKQIYMYMQSAICMRGKRGQQKV